MAGKRAVESDGEGERSSVASQKRTRLEENGSVAASPLKVSTNGVKHGKGKAAAGSSVSSSPQASSSSNQEPVRVQTDSEGEDDDLDMSGMQAAHGNPQPNEGEESDFEPEEEDEEEQAQVQRGAARLKQEEKKIGAVRKAGVMERLDLDDFMCHEHLGIDLGPQVNFVVGQNGSGKSAILAGITLALGGKAASTQRGNSFKEFVKRGCSQGRVTLRLGNRGAEAYQPEIFGKAIHIQRTVKREGGGDYKVQDANRKTVSTRREDLQAMLDHFGIQPDSPLCILSQDMSAKFLKNSSSKEKYALFIRGTQLQQLTEDYEIIRTSIGTMHVQLKNKRDVLPELHKTAKYQKERWQDAEKAQDQAVRLTNIRKDLAWAYVKEQEEVCRKAELAVEDEETVLKDIREQIAEHQEAVAELELVIQQLDEESRQEGRDGELEEQLDTQLRDIKAQIKTRVEEMKRLHAETRQLGTAVKEAQQQLRTAQQAVDAENRKAAANSDGSRQEHIDRKEALQIENVAIQQELIAIDRELAEIDRQGADANEEQQTLSSNTAMCREEVERAGNRLGQMKRAQGDRLAAYGNHMGALLQAIIRERWNEQPIGPLGRYMHVTDAKWASVIERVLDKEISSFLVTNNDDERKLRGLMVRVGQDANIFRTRRDIFNYDEPDPSFTTLLRCMRFDDDFVKRVVINSAHIEGAVLIEERAAADEFMKHPPPRVQTCYSHKYKHGGAGAGGMMAQPIKDIKGLPRLTEDVQSAIAAAANALMQAEANLAVANSAHDDWQKRMGAMTTKMKTLKGHRQKKDDRINRNHNIIRELEDKLQESETSDVQALVDVKESVETELAEVQRQLEDVLYRKDQAAAANLPLVTEQESILARLQQLGAVHAQWHARMEQAVTQRRGWLTAVEAGAKKADRQTAKIDEAKQAHQACLAKLDEDLETTYEICGSNERIQVRKNSKKLISEMSALEKAITNAQNKQGASLEEIQHQFAAAQENFSKAESAINDLGSVIKLLKNSLALRIAAWKAFQKHISIRAKMMFVHHLSRRDFTGRLNFNHAKGRLDIQVQTDQGSTQRLKDVKSLSGGEKSFSTISLLLTLWDAVSCPIRCLDEFDVFMDAANRKVSVKMMLDAALKANEVQYCFITPLKIEGFQLGPEIVVNKLADPKRADAAAN